MMISGEKRLKRTAQTHISLSFLPICSATFHSTLYYLLSSLISCNFCVSWKKSFWQKCFISSFCWWWSCLSSSQVKGRTHIILHFTISLVICWYTWPPSRIKVYINLPSNYINECTAYVIRDHLRWLTLGELLRVLITTRLSLSTSKQNCVQIQQWHTSMEDTESLPEIDINCMIQMQLKRESKGLKERQQTLSTKIDWRLHSTWISKMMSQRKEK